MSKRVTISASEGHRGFGKLLKRVFRSDEHLIVERDGFPVAVLLSYHEYERLRRAEAATAFDQFSRGLGRDVEQQGLTEEELRDELQRVRQQIYHEQYGSGT